jgi:hypothetical protein
MRMSIVNYKQPQYYINDSTNNVLWIEKGRGEVFYLICVLTPKVLRGQILDFAVLGMLL